MNTKKQLTIPCLLLAATITSGCALLQPASDTPIEETPAIRLLYYARALQQASPSGRAAMLATARHAYEQNDDSIHAARLALAYGQPGYPGYAPDNCQRYASKALDDKSDGPGPAAAILLHQLVALCADNVKVRQKLDTAMQRNHKMKQQLKQTKQLLTSTQKKLHALSRIESQINP